MERSLPTKGPGRGVSADPGGRSAAMRSRRALWRGLGVLWLVDALLQAQPAMFTAAFVGNVLAPAAYGQPYWLAVPMQLFDGLWGRLLIPANVVAIVVQFAIALPLLLAPERKWGRIGLVVSIVWSAGVWIFGEGLGGLLTGTGTFLTGAPGSVALYALGALFLLIPAWLWEGGEVLRWLEEVLGFLWIGGAVLQALPNAGFWTPDGLSGIFASVAASPQPSFLSAPIAALAASTETAPVAWNLLFVAVLAAAGLALVRGAAPTLTYGLAFAWSFFTWWFGQAFGMLGTGLSTDPNSGIVWMLLFACLAIGRLPLPQDLPRNAPSWREAVASASAVRWRRSF